MTTKVSPSRHPAQELLDRYALVLNRDDVASALEAGDADPQDDVLPTEAHRNLLAASRLLDTRDDAELAVFCLERNLAAAARAIARRGASSPAWPAFVEGSAPAFARWQSDDALGPLVAAGLLAADEAALLSERAVELHRLSYLSTSPVRVWEDIVLAARVAAALQQLSSAPSGSSESDRGVRGQAVTAARDVAERLAARVREYVVTNEYEAPETQQLGLDRLDAGALSVLARSLDDDSVLGLHGRVTESGLIEEHAQVVRAGVGRDPTTNVVPFADARWLTVGDAGEPGPVRADLGVVALTRPYAVLLRAETLEESLQLRARGELDPLLLHELTHTTQAERFTYRFDPDPGWLHTCELALMEGATEALARRMAETPIPAERDPEPYPMELLLAETLAVLVSPEDPGAALVEASNAESCLEYFAAELRAERVQAMGIGETTLALAKILDSFAEQVTRRVEALAAGRGHPVRLTWLGDIQTEARVLARALDECLRAGED